MRSLRAVARSERLPGIDVVETSCLRISTPGGGGNECMMFEIIEQIQ